MVVLGGAPLAAPRAATLAKAPVFGASNRNAKSLAADRSVARYGCVWSAIPSLLESGVLKADDSTVLGTPSRSVSVAVPATRKNVCVPVSDSGAAEVAWAVSRTRPVTPELGVRVTRRFSPEPEIAMFPAASNGEVCGTIVSVTWDVSVSKSEIRATVMALVTPGGEIAGSIGAICGGSLVPDTVTLTWPVLSSPSRSTIV